MGIAVAVEKLKSYQKKPHIARVNSSPRLHVDLLIFKILFRIDLRKNSKRKPKYTKLLEMLSTNILVHLNLICNVYFYL